MSSTLCPKYKIGLKSLELDEVDEVLNKCSKLCVLKNNVELIRKHIMDIILVYKKIRHNNYRNISRINYNLGIMYFLLNDERAIKYLLHSSTIYDDALIVLGYYYMLNRNYQYSRKYLMESFRNCNKMATLFLGILDKTDNQNATQYFRIIKKSDVDGNFIVMVGDYYASRGFNSKAKKYYNLAIAISDNKKAHVKLADMYIKYAKHDDAIIYLEKAVDKGSITALNMLCNVHKKRYNGNKGLEYLKIAVQKNQLNSTILSYFINRNTKKLNFLFIDKICLYN